VGNLVTFNSKAAGEFYMLREHATAVLGVIGKDLTPEGIITIEQVPAALAALQTAVDRVAAASKAAPDNEEAERELPPAIRSVGFAQRAFPLLDMLRAAQKKRADVIWSS
jgi:Domain of unknown function (DUF1840)